MSTDRRGPNWTITIDFKGAPRNIGVWTEEISSYQVAGGCLFCNLPDGSTKVRPLSRVKFFEVTPLRKKVKE